MKFVKTYEKFQQPAFCGLLVLNNQKLLELVKDLDPTWERIAHHMTIQMGGLPEELKYRKGEIVPLTVTHIGELDNKVIAVKVETEIKTKTEFPHITLSVNRENGGKPFLSNKIIQWKSIDPFTIKGKISEFTSDSKSI